MWIADRFKDVLGLNSLLALTLSCLWQPCLGGAAVHIDAPGSKGTIRVSVDQSARAELVLLVYDERGSARRIATEISAGARRGEYILSFDCRPGTYVVTAPDLISTPVRLDGISCDYGQLVPLVPAASVHGVVQQPRTRNVSLIVLAVSRCGTRGIGDAIGEYVTSTNGEGAFNAAVPAGCLDLVVRQPTYAPVRIPTMTLAFRQSRDLGRLEFKPGATLAVRTVGPDGSPVRDALVSVVQPEALSRFVMSLVNGTSAQVVSEARTDGAGHASFVGVTGDLVYVVARAGTRTAFGGPVELRQGDLVTQPLQPIDTGTIRVMTVGGTEWLAPGAVLSVSATPSVCGQWVESAKVSVGVGDEVLPTKLPFAGQWRVDLYMIDGGRGTLVDTQEVNAQSGADTVVTFVTSRGKYQGRVLVGGKTYAGRLTLQPEVGASVAAFTANVEEGGDFEVWLPSAGTFRARFVDTHRTMALRNGSARFVAGTRATIRFDVGSQVPGVVVLSDGSPVSGATVLAQPTVDDISRDAIRSGLPMEKSDSAGQFVFQNLEYGAWDIQATLGGRASPPQAVSVSANMQAAPVRLVLGDSGTVKGRVVDAGGDPVPAAKGRFGVETGSPTSVPPGGVFVTDEDGYFSMDVGSYVGRPLQIAVAGMGRPLAAFRVTALQAGEPVTLSAPAPSDGGRVRLIFPRQEDRQGTGPDRLNLYTLVNEQGALLPVSDAVNLFGAPVLRGPESITLLIPLLAPGRWRLADFADARAGLLFMAGFGRLPVLREFVVQRGATVEVDIR